MALTLKSATKTIDNINTTTTDIDTFLATLTVLHIYGVSVIPISNQEAKILVIYD